MAVTIRIVSYRKERDRRALARTLFDCGDAMKKISLNARTSFASPHASDVEVVLFRLSHPQLQAPILFSTDPTQRVSIEPLRYATRSRWRAAEPEDYLFILVSALVPEDKRDQPTSGSFVLHHIDQETMELVRSIQDRPSLDMAVVMASTPDVLEAEFRNLEIVSVEANRAEMTLQFAGPAYHLEPWPARRMTKDAFPGLFK